MPACHCITNHRCSPRLGHRVSRTSVAESALVLELPGRSLGSVARVLPSLHVSSRSVFGVSRASLPPCRLMLHRQAWGQTRHWCSRRSPLPIEARLLSELPPLRPHRGHGRAQEGGAQEHLEAAWGNGCFPSSAPGSDGRPAVLASATSLLYRLACHSNIVRKQPPLGADSIALVVSLTYTAATITRIIVAKICCMTARRDPGL